MPETVMLEVSRSDTEALWQPAMRTTGSQACSNMHGEGLMEEKGSVKKGSRIRHTAVNSA
eukprot:3928051-Amphidinium_carterae.1